MDVSIYMLCHSIVVGLFTLSFISAMTFSAVECRTQKTQSIKDSVMICFMFSGAMTLMFFCADIWLITQKVS